MEPWHIAVLTCLIALLFIAFRFKHNRRPPNEEEIPDTAPQVETQLTETEEVSPDTVTNQQPEVVESTRYCKNGCQGACACPVLDGWLNEPTENIEEISVRSIDYEITPEPDYEDIAGRKNSMQRKYTWLRLKEKLGRRSSTDHTKEGDSGRMARLFAYPRKKSIERSKKTNGVEGSPSANEETSDVRASSSETDRRRESLKVLRGMISFKKHGRRGENDV